MVAWPIILFRILQFPEACMEFKKSLFKGIVNSRMRWKRYMACMEVYSKL
jgi:hypothetical protein